MRLVRMLCAVSLYAVGNAAFKFCENMHLVSQRHTTDANHARDAQVFDANPLCVLRSRL